MTLNSVRLSLEFLELVSKDAKGSNNSISEQIDYYYRLGRLAEQFEDLPISMIKSLMVSMKEEANLLFVKKPTS